ncbi:MAG: hypothetical protein WC453_03555 [Patescibacteria group bacterium]
MLQERYSLSRAGTEAAKIKEIAGATAANEDYEAAHDLVQNELLDNYLSFDRTLFHHHLGNTRAEEIAGREEAIKKYQNFLQSDRLKAVLSGEEGTEVLAAADIEALCELVRYESLPSHLMIKNPLAFMTEKLCQKTGMAPLDSKHEEYLMSRTRNHLFRLLLPEIYFSGTSEARYVAGKQNTVCPAFAQDFLKGIADLPDPNWQEADKFNRTIGAEGSGPSAFWTLAPYIHDELQRRELPPESSMQKIFAWIRSGYEHKKDSSDGYANLDWDARCLDYLDQSYDGVFAKHNLSDLRLGFDERMPSHLLARLFAKSVVEKMEKE